MNINREILMTIVKNSSNRLEVDQEILEINEQQLAIISKELTKLFSLHGVFDSKRVLKAWDNGYSQGYDDGNVGRPKHKDLNVY